LAKQKYRLTPPTIHRKIRDESRSTTSVKYGKKTKYRIAFVQRETVKGLVKHIYIDPRTTSEAGVFSSTEAYVTTSNHLDGTFSDVTSTPTGKVFFRWINRQTLRSLRRKMSWKGTKLIKRQKVAV